MLLTIDHILDQDQLSAIAGALTAGSIHFMDGAASAGWHARSVKHNEQAAGPGLAPLISSVRTRLLEHPLFSSAARPKALTGVILSRYKPGMAYGTHVDNAVMGGVRTDLSFTLFLAAPESYEGGELVIEGNGEEIEVKLPAGSLVLYPSTSLHRVAEVKAGERLAIVGWVRSLVRSHEQREILFDLDAAIAGLREGAPRPLLDRLLKIRANLQRGWIED